MIEAIGNAVIVGAACGVGFVVFAGIVGACWLAYRVLSVYIEKGLMP